MASDEAFDAFVRAVFEHLPLFFNRDAAGAQAALNAAGYRMARQQDGQPMLALPVGRDAVCIVAKPDLPLPKAKLMAEGAAGHFDRFTEIVRAQGFQLASGDKARPGMRVETYSATEPGPIISITVMRALASEHVLLAAAMPPVQPRA